MWFQFPDGELTSCSQSFNFSWMIVRPQLCFLPLISSWLSMFARVWVAWPDHGDVQTWWFFSSEKSSQSIETIPGASHFSQWVFSSWKAELLGIWREVYSSERPVGEGGILTWVSAWAGPSPLTTQLCSPPAAAAQKTQCRGKWHILRFGFHFPPGGAAVSLWRWYRAGLKWHLYLLLWSQLTQHINRNKRRRMDTESRVSWHHSEEATVWKLSRKHEKYYFMRIWVLDLIGDEA